MVHGPANDVYCCANIYNSLARVQTSWQTKCNSIVSSTNITGLHTGQKKSPGIHTKNDALVYMHSYIYM